MVGRPKKTYKEKVNVHILIVEVSKYSPSFLSMKLDRKCLHIVSIFNWKDFGVTNIFSLTIQRKCVFIGYNHHDLFFLSSFLHTAFSKEVEY